MDTQAALTTLQTLSQNLGAQVTQLSTEKDAVDIAITQLQGTLQTQVTDDQKRIADLESQVDTITQQAADLQAPQPATADIVA